MAPSLNLPIDENINKQWFFIDMNCGERSINLLMNTDEKYFAHPFRWIIVDATHDSIKNLTFLPDSNIILANWDDKSQRYSLEQGNFFNKYTCNTAAESLLMFYFPNSLPNWTKWFIYLRRIWPLELRRWPCWFEKLAGTRTKTSKFAKTSIPSGHSFHRSRIGKPHRLGWLSVCLQTVLNIKIGITQMEKEHHAGHVSILLAIIELTPFPRFPFWSQNIG